MLNLFHPSPSGERISLGGSNTHTHTHRIETATRELTILVTGWLNLYDFLPLPQPPVHRLDSRPTALIHDERATTLKRGRRNVMHQTVCNRVARLCIIARTTPAPRGVEPNRLRQENQVHCTGITLSVSGWEGPIWQAC